MSNIFKSFGKAVEKGVKSQVKVAKKASNVGKRAAKSTDRFVNTAQTSGLGEAARGAKRDIKTDMAANKQDYRDARNDYQGAVGTAIDSYQNGVNHQLQNDKSLTGNIGHGLGMSDRTIDNIQATPDALASLSAGDARLLNMTQNANTGVFSKADRIEATKKDAQGLQAIKTIGGAAAATTIPIVSWIGLAANAIANQRLSEAGVQSEGAGYRNFGTTYVTAGAGAYGAPGQMAAGALRGGVNAKEQGGDVGKGALVGGITAAAPGLGQAVGGTAGAAIGGALGSGAAAYAGGARGSDLTNAALGGALQGGIGNYGKTEGWAPWATGAAQGAVRGGLNGGGEGALYGALGGGLNASGTVGRVANTALQQQRNQQLARARATQRTSTSPYATGRV